MIDQAKTTIKRISKMMNLSNKMLNIIMLLLMGLSMPHWVLAQTEAVQSIRSVGELQEAVAERNPQLKASFSRYMARLERVPQVRQLPDPELAFGYFIQPIETRVGPQQARISISQMLPWFGKRASQSTVADRKAKAAYQDFVTDRNRLFYQAEQLWYRWYELETSIHLIDEHIRILNSFEQLALRQYEVDKGEQIDVLRVQMQRDDIETRLADFKDQRQSLWEELRALTRLEETQLILPDSLTQLDRSYEHHQLVSRIEQIQPMLEALEQRRLAADEAINASRLDGMPSIGVGLDYIFTGERYASISDNGKDAMLARTSIKIPIYRKGDAAKVREAKLEEKSLADQWQSKRDQLALETEQALNRYRDAERRIDLYQKGQLQRIQQALDILIEQYSTDGSDFEEILRLESKKLDYKLELERALVAQHLAEARIRFLTSDYQAPIQPSTASK